jgi:hypothetical protein
MRFDGAVVDVGMSKGFWPDRGLLLLAQVKAGYPEGFGL